MLTFKQFLIVRDQLVTICWFPRIEPGPISYSDTARAAAHRHTDQLLTFLR